MLQRLRLLACCCSALALAAFVAVPAHAALTPYDVPIVTCESSTLSSITLHVCAGASGAPAGVTIQWKKKADFDASGWADDGTLCKLSLSGQPSMQHPEKSRWELLPGECEDITIGDINFDETGVSGEGCGLDPLECGTEYVFRWFAHAGRGFGRSDFGGDLICSTAACPTSRCTFTQGYWKNHGTGDCANPKPENSGKWPASATPMSLGTSGHAYTAAELCSILNTSAGGNCLISLAHQLITAKLNLANGATSCPALVTAIAQAEAAIGNKVVPPVGSGSISGSGCGSVGPITSALTAYNEGGLCSPNCGDSAQQLKPGATPGATTPVQKKSWGSLKSIYR